jgi:hypothetical protein
MIENPSNFYRLIGRVIGAGRRQGGRLTQAGEYQEDKLCGRLLSVPVEPKLETAVSANLSCAKAPNSTGVSVPDRTAHEGRRAFRASRSVPVWSRRAHDAENAGA